VTRHHLSGCTANGIGDHWEELSRIQEDRQWVVDSQPEGPSTSSATGKDILGHRQCRLKIGFRTVCNGGMTKDTKRIGIG